MSEEYRDKVIDAVIDTLRSILGEVTVQALEVFMKMNGTSLYSIYDEPDRVTNLLYVLFKSSARFLEDEIVKEVCLRLGHEYNCKVSLNDIINSIKYKQ
ncbi:MULTISPECIES: NitrOD5 domain-containing protein [Candidatus Nitrosocaldus]|jgi:hypothetical protein|uniref:Uncharacterized protein n=1 Tax=Candidatus Nitrosocaldus cavascurensis TaxID=2058097 RepID=A0A2K5AT96_9ARCH|nr:MULTISPECIES: NitrOD5 domain-containing protein [Candidatus Nitrosocaldus]SPC34834.1 protein of unknown function [Candidatus Nitrosocaldus cavascurensis]